MTEMQTIMLRRLSAEFNVDVTPADGLTGAALDMWIDAAEDELFLRLMAEREKERGTVKCPRK